MRRRLCGAGSGACRSSLRKADASGRPPQIRPPALRPAVTRLTVSRAGPSGTAMAARAAGPGRIGEVVVGLTAAAAARPVERGCRSAKSRRGGRWDKRPTDYLAWRFLSARHPLAFKRRGTDKRRGRPKAGQGRKKEGRDAKPGSISERGNDGACLVTVGIPTPPPPLSSSGRPSGFSPLCQTFRGIEWQCGVRPHGRV